MQIPVVCSADLSYIRRDLEGEHAVRHTNATCRRHQTLLRSITYPGIALAAILTVLPVSSTAHAQSADCLRDVQGPDDEPGQKDLNQFCDLLGNNAPYELTVTWNLDDTAWSGSNTGDACALFDTDGDHNANYGLCVTVIGGPPAVIKPGTPKLYSCADTRPDRCVGSVPITGFASTCSVG